jgi:5-formyltetrahydrofolate cyclo-ligase
MCKKELRQKYLSLRDKKKVSEAELTAICTKILSLFDSLGLRKIYLYRSFGSEVDLANRLLKIRPELVHCYPRIQEGNNLQFVRYVGQGFEKNKYGIEEPLFDESLLDSVNPETLLLTPCLAVNRDGYRLGYGGGYYDRFLSGNKAAISVAGVLDEFLVDDVIVEKFDQRVAYIVSPTVQLRCS